MERTNAVKARKLFACSALIAGAFLPQLGCWDFGFGGALYSSLGSGFYDDGTWGNWYTDTYVGNGIISGDGFYCIDGDCSPS